MAKTPGKTSFVIFQPMMMGGSKDYQKTSPYGVDSVRTKNSDGYVHETYPYRSGSSFWDEHHSFVARFPQENLSFQAFMEKAAFNLSSAQLKLRELGLSKDKRSLRDSIKIELARSAIALYGAYEQLRNAGYYETLDQDAYNYSLLFVELEAAVRQARSNGIDVFSVRPEEIRAANINLHQQTKYQYPATQSSKGILGNCSTTGQFVTGLVVGGAIFALYKTCKK